MNLVGDNLYIAYQICRMVEFLIGNINPTQYTEVSNCYTCETTHSRGEMEVMDISISKLQVERGIL